MEEKPDTASTATKPKTLYLASLGCPKNLVDSEVMLGTLVSQGFQLTTNRGEAEVIVVNTCGFLQTAAKESIEMILDLAREKQTGNCQQLVVAGCLTERYQRELPRELPEVDLFIGTNDYEKIGALLGGEGERPYPLYLPTSQTPRLLATPPHTAYVKIAEGCNHTCSFCMIPQIRGKQRSRPVDDIVKEVKNLLAMGVKEMNLVAQDTTDYGGDLHDGTTIETLFEALSKTPGDHWFRLMYAYPLRFSDALIEIMAASPNFCRYVDIPFQHINDRILRSMRRGSGGASIRNLIERLRRRISGVAIRSTFIVGYPGETEEAFTELYDFLEDYQLERVGVFPFSREPGTPAFELPDQVPDKTKRERRRALLSLQREISTRKNRLRIGQNLRVLVEEGEKRPWGRTEWDAPEIDGKVFIEGPVRQGNWAHVVVDAATPYDLTGRVC